ncbi:MAG TPA: DUF3575 domain-containing protein [Puia sp.]|jgi:hypothetical protein|nr:DUF3575 domain-containing protein [Puia sp.]
MKLLAAFLLLLFSQNAYCQKENFSIKLCPLALFDEPSFPTIQGGFEFKLSRKITWYTEAGIKYRKSYYENADTNFIASNGFKLKTEIRYYLQNRNKSALDGLYFAANVFFTRDLHNTEIRYHTQKDTVTKTDAFGAKKNIFGINLICGYQLYRSKQIGIDVYGGLGIRFRSISTINKEYNKNTDVMERPIDPNIDAIRQQIDADAGASIAPNLTLGLRICYRFRK